MKKNEKKIEDCPIRRTFNVIGSKWRLLIIEIMRDEKKRYGELKRHIPDISEKVLNEELKILVKDGFLNKKSYPEVPPKVEYSLTDKGEKILPIIDSITVFAMEHMLYDDVSTPCINKEI
ncbi:winged helix-turn-helix transcriptional regulator [Chryseobacterium jejuense]|uniref:HTH-type transcriptional activator hxlR n=1 Tax=Chryseobacterium jejuense TaxID=445960 RepID=A0A2X2VNV8_CHRJE|nr:helix-turn-helix domain-containing protein [Chryseobacterium jejuense]SDI37476.1 transcriptional regulator, HxlR family [Chryseobacterium jejuense]SQB26873.1 HTH-type transcriptional activator hxlR [Chryseobacterium jejuense]